MSFSKAILFILALFCFWAPALAQIEISEIMYDVSGSDTGREWVEITNTGSGSVIVATSTWKFFESNTNHGLTLFQGGTIIPVGGFAVIADNPQKFLIDWPQFSGTIFDSTFSLGNTSELIAVKNATSTIVDQVTYASGTGAAGDGNSLQKVGGVWKALAPTPGFANQNNQNTTGSGSQGATASTTEPAVSGSGDAVQNSLLTDEGKTNWPVEPQIISRIIGPARAIAGADVVFQGEAVGLDKKPLKNIRYLWNFGDGGTKEGERVMHAYNFPADYVVILEVSSGNFESSSRFRIKAIPSNIRIASATSGFEGEVELANDTKEELDLSWWRIRSGGQFFTLPKNTKMLPAGRLPLSAAVMGFPVADTDVALLYPNGSLAYQFTKSVPDETTVVSYSPNVALENQPETLPEISGIPSHGETPKVSSQTATAVSAFDTGVEVKAGEQESTADNTKPRPSLWLYGAGGVIILGLGFALFPKPLLKPTGSKSLSEEFTIVEDI